MKIGRELTPRERMTLESLLMAVHEVSRTGLLHMQQSVMKDANNVEHLTLLVVFPDEILITPIDVEEEIDVNAEYDPKKVN